MCKVPLCMFFSTGISNRLRKVIAVSNFVASNVANLHAIFIKFLL